MEIYKQKDDFFKVFSLGIEEDYRGTSIVYRNDTKTFVYYYFPNHKRLYIIDGKKEEINLVNIVEKVRIIGILKNREVNYFKKYLKEIIKNQKIFYMNDDFFVDVITVLKSRKPVQSEILQVYYKNIEEQEVYNGL